MGKLPVTVDDVLTAAHSTTIAIASAATVYTKAWEWGTGEDFSLDYNAASSGVIGSKIELEQGNVLPTTEGAVDADNWAVAENAQDIESNLAEGNQHFKKLSPVVSKYGRLKITGSGSNDASTTLKAKLSRQEEL